MKDKYFIDTNILVYAHDTKDAKKSEIAGQLIFDGLLNGNCAISGQVLSEFFVTITKKVENPLSPLVAKNEIDLLKSLEIVEINLQLVLSAIDIHVKHNISYWDSLIIASAQKSKCSYLYSEDLNHNQKYDNVKICNPFKALLH